MTPWSDANTRASTVQSLSHAEGDILSTLGEYKLLKSLGKGGMGEVFYAFEPTCGRYVALKQVREDLKGKKHLYTRFLREARITSQLTHPSIIPIYAIHHEGDHLYYTMPFVAGDTLKTILRDTLRSERAGHLSERSGGAISRLAGTFLKVCQAVAFAHARGVIHRDIKPENIMIGDYGEVIILDWGLAKIIAEPKLGGTAKADEGDTALTRIGKIVGTVNYMSPERALGHPCTVQADIYSLGVILYQILTLHLPFRRGPLKEFRQSMRHEEFVSPSEISPYREVPDVLARIAKRCLDPKPSARYQSVDAIIADIEGYLEGRSEWYPQGELNPKVSEGWKFQEHVLLAEQVAITRGTAFADWVQLMISRQSFGQNIRVDSTIKIAPDGHGIGLIVAIPETQQRTNIFDGVCVWLSADASSPSQLLRGGVEVLAAPGLVLEKDREYAVSVKRIDNSVHVYVDGVEQLTYVSQQPLYGTHVGVMARDDHYQIPSMKIFSGSDLLVVSCLAIPDAFLAAGDYERALVEYRRVAYAFATHAEGREAQFRAGITLLEQAKHTKEKKKSTALYDKALEEMSRLHDGPAAPLAYLGKALVYRALANHPDEVRCYELALRRYKTHPLLPLVSEHLVYRMHEAARQSRFTAYSLSLLAIRHVEPATGTVANRHLFSSLQDHWEKLPFFFPHEAGGTIDDFGVRLAFWLGRPWVLGELLEEAAAKPGDLAQIGAWTPIGNALFALIELGSRRLAEEKLVEVMECLADAKPTKEARALAEAIRDSSMVSIRATKRTLARSMETTIGAIRDATNTTRPTWLRTYLYLIELCLRGGRGDLALSACEQVSTEFLSEDQRPVRDAYEVWALLLQGDWNGAGELLHTYPLEILNHETSLLNFVYGCWLLATEGKEIADIHFYGALEFAFPRSWALTHHYLLGKLDKGQNWDQEAFVWERRQLNRQLTLYYHCMGDDKLVRRYQRRERQCYVDVGR